MKNGKQIYYYIASSLALLIPVPGRFAFGIFVILLFNIQMIIVSMLVHAIDKMNLAILKNPLIAFALIAVTILCKLILTFVCPIAAMTLGFCIYLPALTSAVIEFFFSTSHKTLREDVASTALKSLKMSAYVLVYYLIKDVVGYGTLTLPAWKKLLVLNLPYNPEGTTASMFIATIPGSLVFIAILLSIYLVYSKKIEIISNAKTSEGDNK